MKKDPNVSEKEETAEIRDEHGFTVIHA